MKNNGLFSSLFIEELKNVVKLDDAAQGRMATLAQTWRSRNSQDTESLWESFLKQALSYLEFVPPGSPTAPGVYPLFEDWGFNDCIGVLYLAPPDSDIDNVTVGSFYPAKLLAQLRERKLNWGILTNGALWRLYSTKSSRPYEDYVELPLEQALEGSDEAEYGLFEAFFHKECFLNDESGIRNYESKEKEDKEDSSFVIRNCKLDFFREESERILTEKVKTPFLAQVDEVLQYICNGFIFDTQKSGEEYTNGGLFDDEEERFLGQHQLRNDFMCRALYLLAFVEPYNSEPDGEYAIPYEDLEVRHLGELYENILEYTVLLADADRIRRRTKKGVEMLLASQTTRKQGDTLIKKGDVYFGESALERKQTGSYYTPESLVRFLNEKTIVQPLNQKFEQDYRDRFDELLEQARNGHDVGTRRGAAQASSAMVERFVEEVVLKFKVCDPAMGSGHFLVDAANQMAGLVVALLEEVPHVEGMRVSVTSRPNDWRRRITRHCIYGVDLNPLAVNLAKLSLWLNCFAIEHKLTFLDHHVRCGNSLIGIRSLDQLASIPERRKESNKKKDKQQLLLDYNDLSSALAEAGQGIASITQIDEDDTDSQKAVLDEALDATSHLRPLGDLFAAYLMDPEIQPDEYKEIFERLAKGMSVANTLNPALPEILESVEAYREWHHFYHWPLEFPDVFGPDGDGGFSATVGNPPWDIVKPNSQEFFLNYDPKFRSYKKQEANRVSKKLMADNPAIAEKWEEYCDGFTEQSAYFKEPLSYSALGRGDINTFKLFLEQFFTVLNKGRRMGIVVPSGLYTDQGCQPLRERFFYESKVAFLYGFENRWPTVFSAVDGRFKFITFGTKKGGKTDRFRCAFMEHDPERLPLIDANALKMSVKQVKKFSPDTLSVMEFKNQRDIDVTAKIYGDWPLLIENIKNTWNVKLTREFDTSTDSGLFKDTVNDCPLYEGKIIWSYDNRFSPVNYWLTEVDVRQREIQKKWKTLFKVNKRPEKYDYTCFRCGFRRIAASTNERTCLATIIPAMATCPDTTVTVSRVDYDPILGRTTELISAKQSMALLGFFNSFVLDFIVRQKITTHLDMHFMYGLPVPRGKTDVGDRAQLRAEIDAYVAHLYGLSRDDFAYILDTFPVLKKKEEKAFGEFMSKRKCLEEFDRICKLGIRN